MGINKGKAAMAAGVVVSAMAAGALAGYKLMHPSVLVRGKGDIKVACVGDSITFGQGVLGRRGKEAYPSILAEALGEDYCTENYGLSNRTLLSTGNMPYFEEKVGKESLDSNADIVLFMLGSNDSKKGNWNEILFREEYETALQSYKKMQSHPKVYALIPPKVFIENPTDMICSDEIINDRIRKIIPEIAENTGVSVIDLYIFTKYHPEWFADKIHLNAKGNRAVAEYIAGLIKED